MKVDRFPRKHPLCTCPEATFTSAPDQSKCAGGRIAHPIITADDAARLIEQLKEHHAGH